MALHRTQMALEAALGVAGALGVAADRPRILKDSNNTIVHIAPAALVDRFADVDRESLALLRRMRSASVAVKCWVEPSCAPEVLEAAQGHLALLRGQGARDAP